MNNKLNFDCCSVRIEDDQTDDVFYVFPDVTQKNQKLPETLDDAYGNGYLTISLWDDKFATWYLNIANEEYTGSFQELSTILYNWSQSEGYEF